MPNETRIATWNDAAPAPRQTVPELLYSYRVVIAVVCAIPLGALFLGQFDNLEELGIASVVAVALACGIVLLVSMTKRYYGYYITPMPVVYHGDALPRINAVLRFEVNGHVYGEDRGELTIIDNWLVFEGERTGFSVSPEDVTDYARMPAERGRPQMSFGLEDTGGQIRVRILAEPYYKDPGEFLYLWSHRKAESPRIAILPPLEPMPGYRRGYLRYAVDNPTLSTAQFLSAVFAPLLSLQLAGATHSIRPVFLILGLYLILQIVLRHRAGVARQRALQSLSETGIVLTSSPVSQGLPPIPPVYAMRAGAKSPADTQAEASQTQS